jgi:hypothetical protein
MEVEMKTHSFIAAVAAFGVSTLAFTAGDAFAAKIIPIQGKYSKIKLDGICAANGGNSYGTADTAYGCSKGNVTVECNKDGSCTGYVFMLTTGAGNHVARNPEALLMQQSQSPAARDVTGASTGVLMQTE